MKTIDSTITSSELRPGRRLRAAAVSEKRVTFRLSPHEKEILDDYCWRYECSMSDVIRDALDILGVVPNWK